MGRITGRSDSNSEFNWIGVPQLAVITIVDTRSLDFVNESVILVPLCFEHRVINFLFTFSNKCNKLFLHDIMQCGTINKQ